MRLLIPLLAFFLLTASPASAQIENCEAYARIIGQIVAGTTVPDPTITLVDIGQTAQCFAVYAAATEDVNRIVFAQFVKRFESSRTDKQSGAGANASGSTSVVAQGPASRVLSVAVEHGALAQSVSGQVVTLRGNLAGLPSVLVRENVFPYCVGGESANQYCVKRSLLSLLRHASFSVSFDANRGTQLTGTAPTASSGQAQPVAYSGTRNEISAASARVELWNQRDTTSPAFVEQWRAKVGTAMNQVTADLLAKGSAFAVKVTEAPGYEEWRLRSLMSVRAAGRDRARIAAALNAALADLVVMVRGKIPEFDTEVAAALGAYNQYFLTQDEFLDSLATKSVLALDYTNNRPIGQPTTSNIRLIFDWPQTKRTRVVANGAVTLYDTLRSDLFSDATRYRDAQAAVELDHGLGDYSILGPATVSLAAYFQYQHAPALLDVDPANPVPGVRFVGLPANAKTVFTKTGNIRLFQAKLALAPPGSSVKIPVAVTYANRTELIDKPTWRAQVGVTYDFDSLFAGLTSR